MEKNILVAIYLIVLNSCSNKTEFPSQDTRIKIGYIDRDLIVYTIDSCEYIGNKLLSSSTAILTHKGNCKFCQKRNGCKLNAR